MNRVTEIERAAITLLTQSRATHPCLTRWIHALASDPDECRGLDEFSLGTWDQRELDDMAAAGFYAPRRFQRFGPDTLTLHLGDGGRSLLAEIDRAVVYLASALVRYRTEGRPDGDQDITIAPDIVVTTSLAAAVVEYHQAMVATWSTDWPEYVGNDDQEDHAE